MPFHFSSRHFSHEKIAFFIALVCFLPFSGFSQAERRALSKQVGFSNFNGIKLGSDISLIPRAELSYLDNNNKFDADSCITYALNTSDSVTYQSDLNLDLVALRTYKNKIVNIYLFFNRATGYKMLRYFLANYGVFTNKPNDYVDIYDWKSISTSVSLRYELRVDLGVAIFTSNTLENQILTDKIKRTFKGLNKPNIDSPNSNLISSKE